MNITAEELRSLFNNGVSPQAFQYACLLQDVHENENELAMIDDETAATYLGVRVRTVQRVRAELLEKHAISTLHGEYHVLRGPRFPEDEP